jgi:hypothetical protein
MQRGYTYQLIEPAGRNFDDGFEPELTPRELLALGVFGGKYMTDCRAEFPASWFRRAKLSPERHDPSLNYFSVNASQPLSVWRRNDWIYRDDPRGWFQWYCRLLHWVIGVSTTNARCVRLAADDATYRTDQTRVRPLDLDCRRRRARPLLHWAYDSRKI